MRILQVVSMGYVCGGAEQSVSQLKLGLQANGHVVKVLSSDYGPADGRFSDYEFPHIRGNLLRRLGRHLWNSDSYRTLGKIISEFQPDVVHFHTMGELSPSVLFALHGTPALLTVHGPEEYTTAIVEWFLPDSAFSGPVSIANLTFAGKAQYAFYKYLQRPLYKRGFHRLNLMVSPSKYLAGVVTKESFGVPVKQIYNGTKLPAQKTLPDKEKNILYVGRLAHVKGVSVLIEAIAKVHEKLPTTTLSIVGDGPSHEELQRKVDELGLGKLVVFHGWLNRNEVLEQYVKATLVVIPSVWPENQPTVALEALAIGRPVVGTRVGGIPELIDDNITGKIVKPGDASMLADAIVSILKSPEIAKMSQAAYESSQRFTEAQFIDELESTYNQIGKR